MNIFGSQPNSHSQNNSSSQHKSSSQYNINSHLINVNNITSRLQHNNYSQHRFESQHNNSLQQNSSSQYYTPSYHSIDCSSKIVYSIELDLTIFPIFILVVFVNLIVWIMSMIFEVHSHNNIILEVSIRNEFNNLSYDNKSSQQHSISTQFYNWKREKFSVR